MKRRSDKIAMFVLPTGDEWDDSPVVQLIDLRLTNRHEKSRKYQLTRAHEHSQRNKTDKAVQRQFRRGERRRLNMQLDAARRDPDEVDVFVPRQIEYKRKQAKAYWKWVSYWRLNNPRLCTSKEIGLFPQNLDELRMLKRWPRKQIRTFLT